MPSSPSPSTRSQRSKPEHSICENLNASVSPERAVWRTALALGRFGFGRFGLGGFRLGGLVLLAPAVFPLELLNPSRRIDVLDFSGIERVAGRADFHVNLGSRAAG